MYILHQNFEILFLQHLPYCLHRKNAGEGGGFQIECGFREDLNVDLMRARILAPSKQGCSEIFLIIKKYN
jgi:hypothetical protein